MVGGAKKNPRLTLQGMRVLDTFLRQNQEKLSGVDIHRITGLPSGTLYPILARFEKVGWLKSEWENIDPSAAQRPRRRYYSITSEGLVRASQFLGVFDKGIPA